MIFWVRAHLDNISAKVCQCGTAEVACHYLPKVEDLQTQGQGELQPSAGATGLAYWIPLSCVCTCVACSWKLSNAFHANLDCYFGSTTPINSGIWCKLNQISLRGKANIPGGHTIEQTSFLTTSADEQKPNNSRPLGPVTTHPDTRQGARMATTLCDTASTEIMSASRCAPCTLGKDCACWTCSRQAAWNSFKHYKPKYLKLN